MLVASLGASDQMRGHSLKKKKKKKKKALTIPSQSTTLNNSVIWRYVHHAISTLSTNKCTQFT